MHALLLFATMALLASGASAPQAAPQRGTMPADTRDDPLIREIYARETRIWNAYQQGDVESHNALLSDRYRAIYPDGSIHGRPTAEQIASARMSSFRFSDFHAEPLGEHFALVRYIADVEGPGPQGNPLHARYVVGEVWVWEGGEWKVLSYQPTVVN